MLTSHLVHPLILFDGVCNLCSGSVQFIIRRDPQRLFRFASLQSELGQSFLKQAQLPPVELQTLLLVENGKIYKRSTAALRIARRLRGAWKLLYGLIIIPPFIRNFIYNWVARNRYRWFGKKESCWIPTPELRELFLD